MLRDVARAAAQGRAQQAYARFLRWYALPAALLFVIGQIVLSAYAQYRAGQSAPLSADLLWAIRLALLQFAFQFSNNAAIGYWNGREQQGRANRRLAAFALTKHAAALLTLLLWQATAVARRPQRNGRFAQRRTCRVEQSPRCPRLRRRRHAGRRQHPNRSCVLVLRATDAAIRNLCAGEQPDAFNAEPADANTTRLPAASCYVGHAARCGEPDASCALRLVGCAGVADGRISGIHLALLAARPRHRSTRR